MSNGFMYCVFVFVHVASGSSTHSELVVQTHSMGPFATKLQCHLELCNVSFLLPVEGCVQVIPHKPLS